MKTPLVTFPAGRLLIASALLATNLAFAEPHVIGEDDARNGTYGGGWQDGQQSGWGFGPWHLRSFQEGEASYAGFFAANPQANPQLAPSLAGGGRAWGLFANGSAFEQSVAFRAFSAPLATDTTFSLLLDHGEIRSASNPGQASAGIVIRTGNLHDSPGDYNAGARIEILALDGKPNYQVVDGKGITDTGVALTQNGLMIAITPRVGGTYDLELKPLPDGSVTRIGGRPLGGPPGNLDSFAVYSRDAEGGDVFVNGLQLVRPKQ